MNDDNEHRRNLVLRWWEFFNEIANIKPWNMSERQDHYIVAERLIRENSEVVQKELEKSLTHAKRPKGWRCNEY